MPLAHPPYRWLRQAIASVVSQSYPYWQLVIALPSSSDQRILRVAKRFSARDRRIQLQLLDPRSTRSCCANAALAVARGAWITLLNPDDQLSPDALLWVARAIQEHPEAGLIYSDEDSLSEAGRAGDPYFKPAWNPSLQEGQNLVAHLSVFNHQLLRELAGFRERFEGAEDYDLALRCMDVLTMDQVIHIPKILYHRRSLKRVKETTPAHLPDAIRSASKALQDHYKRQGIQARIEPIAEGFRAHLSLPTEPPLVNVVIPTRNQLQLLESCLRSLLEITDYPRLAVLVIDNGSDDAATLAYMQQIQSDPRVKVRRDPREFN